MHCFTSNNHKVFAKVYFVYCIEQVLISEDIMSLISSNLSSVSLRFWNILDGSLWIFGIEILVVAPSLIGIFLSPNFRLLLSAFSLSLVDTARMFKWIDSCSKFVNISPSNECDCDTLHCRLPEPTEFFASFGSLGTCGVVPSAARCNTSDGESFGDEVANPIVGVLGTLLGVC